MRINIRPAKLFFSLLALNLFANSGAAQTTRSYAIEISATVQESPPLIILNWLNNWDGVDYAVFRKTKEAADWGAGTLVPNWLMSYVDSDVAVGGSYEYRVTKSPLPTYGGSGYIFA
ncbi:MAG: hypothetical protein ACR2H1_14065, partial [Limisphaerales bacterium]